MPTLTAVPADTAPPRVDVLFTAGELGGSTVTLTVYQISSVGRVAVRNAVRGAASSGFFVTDYETPLGEVVTYQGEKFDASGVSLGLTATATATLAFEPGWAVFQDPLAPGSWASLQVEARFADSLQRSRDSTLFRRGTRTVALMGELGLLEDVSLRAVTRTVAEGEALEAVLAEGYLLVRTAGMPLPACVHVVVPTIIERPHDARSGGHASVWDISGSEVSRSDLGIIESLVTYAKFKATYATYAAAKLVYSTYLQAKQFPPPEV